MAEEFQESEVVFQENVAGDEEEEDKEQYNFPARNNKAKRKKHKGKKNSVPVHIPENLSAGSWQFRYSEFFEDDDDDGDDEIVPPHVIVSRRVAGKIMAFSLCTGNGRTLKGRDLSEVRNSILRMTGFLET